MSGWGVIKVQNRNETIVPQKRFEAEQGVLWRGWIRKASSYVEVMKKVERSPERKNKRNKRNKNR